MDRRTPARPRRGGRILIRATVRVANAHLRKRHAERVDEILARRNSVDPQELASAYHSLQLHWIESVPGYRDAIRRRLVEEIERVDRERGRVLCVECGGDLLRGRYTEDCSHCLDRRRKHRAESVDRLGREVEGGG